MRNNHVGYLVGTLYKLLDILLEQEFGCSLFLPLIILLELYFPVELKKTFFFCNFFSYWDV